MIIIFLTLQFIEYFIHSLFSSVIKIFTYGKKRPKRPKGNYISKSRYTKAFYSTTKNPVKGKKRVKTPKKTQVLHYIHRNITSRKVIPNRSEYLRIREKSTICLPIRESCSHPGGTDVVPYKYDSDSIYVGVDSFSTYCITNSISDYVDAPRPITKQVKGIHSEPAVVSYVLVPTEY